MKKLMVLSLICTAFLMTACGGGSKLTCKATELDGVVKTVYYFEFDSDDKLDGVEFEETIDFSKVENFQETIGCANLEECMEDAKLELKECESSSHYESCKIKDETKTGLTIRARVAEDALKNDSSTFKKGMTKEEIKKAAEKSEFTCE